MRLTVNGVVGVVLWEEGEPDGFISVAGGGALSGLPKWLMMGNRALIPGSLPRAREADYRW